jgi:hypothetical protein
VREALRAEDLLREAPARGQHERTQAETRADDQAAAIDIECHQKVPLMPKFHIDP